MKKDALAEKTKDQLLAAYAEGRRDFRFLILRGANLSGASLRYANFKDADLENANLRGANLNGCNFDNTKF